jgi:hypothetical protein
MDEDQRKKFEKDVKETARDRHRQRPTKEQEEEARDNARAALGPDASESEINAAAKEATKQFRVDPTTDQTKDVRRELLKLLPQHEMANPDGFTKKTAAEQIDAMAQRMGQEKFAEMEKLMKKYHDLVFAIMERAKDAGVITAEIFEDVVVPNRDNYAAFAPLRHVSDYMSPSLRKQVGTFEQVGNPFDFTIMKMMEMICLNRSLARKTELSN